jgi:hypothetical protein
VKNKIDVPMAKANVCSMHKQQLMNVVVFTRTLGVRVRDLYALACATAEDHATITAAGACMVGQG